jgi:hypothetical protein
MIVSFVTTPLYTYLIDQATPQHAIYIIPYKFLNKNKNVREVRRSKK